MAFCILKNLILVGSPSQILTHIRVHLQFLSNISSSVSCRDDEHINVNEIHINQYALVNVCVR